MLGLPGVAQAGGDDDDDGGTSGNNSAIAINTKNGSSLFKFAFSIRRVHGRRRRQRERGRRVLELRDVPDDRDRDPDRLRRRLAATGHARERRRRGQRELHRLPELRRRVPVRRRRSRRIRRLHEGGQARAASAILREFKALKRENYTLEEFHARTQALAQRLRTLLKTQLVSKRDEDDDDEDEDDDELEDEVEEDERPAPPPPPTTTGAETTTDTATTTTTTESTTDDDDDRAHDHRDRDRNRDGDRPRRDDDDSVTRALALVAAALVLASAAAAAATAASDATPALRETAEKLGEIRSGDITFKMEVDPRGDAEPFGFSFTGPFELGEPGELPRVDVEYTQRANGEDATVRLVSDGERAVALVGGQELELPESAIEELRKAGAEVLGADESDEEGLEELRVDDWLVEPELSDGPDGTDKIEGELDVVEVANGLIELAGVLTGTKRLDEESAQQLREPSSRPNSSS